MLDMLIWSKGRKIDHSWLWVVLQAHIVSEQQLYPISAKSPLVNIFNQPKVPYFCVLSLFNSARFSAVRVRAKGNRYQSGILLILIVSFSVAEFGVHQLSRRPLSATPSLGLTILKLCPVVQRR